MKSIRFTIAGLMALVALVAFGAAALRSGSEAWLDACRLLILSILVAACFLARPRRGREAAFWFGFAVVGWAAFAFLAHVAAVEGSSESLATWFPLRLVEALTDHDETIRGGYAAALRVARQRNIVGLMQVLPIALAGGFAAWFFDRSTRRPPDAT
jgi:hypothetical protein